jgi:hypothetical protein
MGRSSKELARPGRAGTAVRLRTGQQLVGGLLINQRRMNLRYVEFDDAVDDGCDVRLDDVRLRSDRAVPCLGAVERSARNAA